MRFSRLLAAVTVLVLIAAGCGWKPPSAPPPKPDTCTASDMPGVQTVQQAIAGLPPLTEDQAWVETARGHTPNCRLNWVLVGITKAAASSSPQQVLFFDRNTPLGPATPEPRPYITVTDALEKDTVRVQYQWLVGNEPSCCPTGIGSVRFQIGDDGKLKALDPIPTQ
jgi:LppP/LprE lipoprotein